MEKVRWGLLSTANINRRLIPAIRATDRGELTAVASRDAATANAYAAKWEVPHSFGSYQDMLDSEMVDAVYISLPNHLHAEWSIKAMEAGLHVLCEKPFALTLDDVDAMIAASKKHKRILAEAFMYLHHPQTKLAREIVQDGTLGEIAFVRAVFNFAIKTRDNIRLAPEFGGGCLWDVGVYPVSFAQFILGEPPLSVSGSQWVGDTGVDETFGGQLNFSGGRYAHISASFRTPFYTSAEVVGTNGRLRLNRPFVNLDNERVMTFIPKDGEPREIPVPEKELYVGEVKDMHAAILDAAPIHLALDETRNHIKTVLALYQAAQENRVVSLE